MAGNYSQQDFNQASGQGVQNILKVFSVALSEGVKMFALIVKKMVNMFLGKY